MRTYVKRKDKHIWIVYALEKQTKNVVCFNIGRRTNKTLKKVITSLELSEAEKIITDKLKNYKFLIKPEIHSTKFRGINHIERKNLTLRTHLKRLNRKTICFSKSLVILNAILKIYFWGWYLFILQMIWKLFYKICFKQTWKNYILKFFHYFSIVKNICQIASNCGFAFYCCKCRTASFT